MIERSLTRWLRVCERTALNKRQPDEVITTSSANIYCGVILAKGQPNASERYDVKDGRSSRRAQGRAELKGWV